MKRGGEERGTIFSFFKRKIDESSSSSTNSSIPTDKHLIPNVNIIDDQHSPKSRRVEIDDNPLDVSLERDPGKRYPIWKQEVNSRDEIRRAYIKAKPYQPKLPNYPFTLFGNHKRRFNHFWFEKFSWLEYSPAKDAAFCFPCFLFDNNSSTRPAFTTEGFKGWKWVNDGKRCPLLIHEGSVGSPHQNAMKSMIDLMNATTHIDKVINAQTSEEVKKNRLRLSTTIEIVEWLALQGCAFRGHDESADSRNRGNFLSLLEFLAKKIPDINEVVLDNAPKNAKYTSPMIQKEVLHILANRVRSMIREEIGDAKFCLLVDEGQDVAHKEQMAIVLRFVDVHGFIRERFFQIVQVAKTNASNLHKEISSVLTCYNLNIHDMRGQGYDGASNMSGEWNGVQALFRIECPSAYYVHCFAHRLNLALVGAAQKETSLYQFFIQLDAIVNIVCGSPKRVAELKSAQAIEIARMLATGERDTGKGVNQMGNLHRSGATRWSSHFDSIMSLIDMFGATIQVLQFMVNEGSTNRTIGDAAGGLFMMTSFHFVFILHLMSKIMGITVMLCRALQQKSIDILNAMDLVSTTKSLLQTLREEGFIVLLDQVQVVCVEHDISIPEMSSQFRDAVRSCRRRDDITVEHHYHFEIFNIVIDYQLMELNNRFNGEAMELLTLAASLEPRDGFKSFKIEDICSLAARFYKSDFDKLELYHLQLQLEHYELDVIVHPKFQGMCTLSELCRGLVETNKSLNYYLVDRLIRLVLTLPVSIATTERAFSSMKLIKTNPRNSMEEEFFADAMVIYIEREFVKLINEDSVIDEFYFVKNRRVPLR